MVRSALLVGVGLASQASAACTRTLLQDTAAAYIKAQTAGTPSSLPFVSNFTYQENDVVLDIKNGVISQPVTVDFSRSVFDTTMCTIFTEISAATNKHPYVISTQILVADDKITTLRSLIADAGDWVFDATSQLKWAKSEKWDEIPEAKRDTRAVIQAAGDAYLDSWADGKVKVPYGTPCARLEGGMYTGDRSPTTNSCKMPEFPKPFGGCKNRRYVVDEVLGAVGIFNDFPFIDKTKPDGTPSSNFLRVEGGLIRYIHEITICSTKNCGR